MYVLPVGRATVTIYKYAESMHGFLILKLKMDEPETGVTLPDVPVTVTV